MKQIFLLLLLTSYLLSIAIQGNSQAIEYKRITPMFPHKIAYIGGIPTYLPGKISLGIFDANGDGDIDIMQAGKSNVSIHINAGGGNYLRTLKSDFTEFSDVDAMKIKGMTHADIDQDGDQDVLLYSQKQTWFYINDGNGLFSIRATDTIPNVDYGSTVLSDVNGDGYPDLFISGQLYQGGYITNLYLNDGYGNYKLDTQNDFVKYGNCKTAIVDIDQDHDNDIIIFGYNSEILEIETTVYTNNGQGIFTIKPDHNLPDINVSAFEFLDIDGDQGSDLIIGGRLKGSTDYNERTYIYKNDGNGSFEHFPFQYMKTIELQSIDSKDIDGDGDLDVVLLGKSYITIFDNDGNGSFIHHRYYFHPFHLITLEGAVSFIDIENDGDQDLLYMRNTQSFIYENNGKGHFRIIDGGLPGLQEGELIFGDIDNDGDQDGFMIGSTTSVDSTEGMFINDGNGIFHRRHAIEIKALQRSEARFADLNNDNYLDIVITGDPAGAGNFSRTYVALNDKTGHYPGPYESFCPGDLSIADVNNDGFKDILIGCKGYNLMTNDGTGHFTASISSIQSTHSFTKDFADIDGDGDQDVIVSHFYAGTPIQKFINDGNGLFTEVNADDIIDPIGNNIYAWDIELVDFDQDGDIDLLTGGQGSPMYLHLNNGLGDFTLAQNTDFEKAWHFNIEDIDQDGDLDIFTLQPHIFYMNDGTSNFNKIIPPSHSLVSGYPGKSTFSDIDNDGDLDLFLYGLGLNVTHAYRNIKYQLLGDSDNDGVLNDTEDVNQDGNVENDDTDNDGIPDFIDNDDDGDLVATQIEAIEEQFLRANYQDTDDDNIPDYLDNDDDGDGVLTKDEDYNNDGNPLNDDKNNNGIPDYLDSTIAGNKTLSPQLPFSVFPNPTRGELNISLEEYASNLVVKIYDVYGKLVYRNQWSQSTNQIRINTKTFKSGNYFVMIKNDVGSSTKKIVIAL